MRAAKVNTNDRATPLDIRAAELIVAESESDVESESDAEVLEVDVPVVIAAEETSELLSVAAAIVPVTVAVGAT